MMATAHSSGYYLREAIAKAREGDKLAARASLKEACRLDPASEAAWMWRASVAGDTAEAVECLIRVLEISPGNEKARVWLDRIRPETSEDASFRCAFCEHTEDMDFDRCPRCGVVRTLMTDLVGISRNHDVDTRVLRRWITNFSNPVELGRFEVQFYMAIAHLNLHDSGQALVHMDAAHGLNPDFEGLRGQIEALRRRKAILIADDSLTIRSMIATSLEQSLYRTSRAADGFEAMDALKREVPDLVLLDVTMPHLDGYEVCRRIKGDPRTRKVPVVMLSGHDGFFDKVRGRVAGASDYLTKPFEPALLLRVIRKYMD